MTNRYLDIYDSKKKSCEIIQDDIGGVFSDIGNCFETVLDEKKKTSGLIGNLFSLTKSVTKLTWDIGNCAVKNTPAAIDVISELKKELSSSPKETKASKSKQELKLLLEKLS